MAAFRIWRGVSTVSDSFRINNRAMDSFRLAWPDWLAYYFLGPSFIYKSGGRVMGKTQHVVAIVGSYRKGGVIDSTIDEILSAARSAGALTDKLYLTEQNIESCRNCRVCTQEADARRGLCVIQDDVDTILNKIEAADAFILGSPMNFGTVTAVMKIFIERLVCYAYWPWGAGAPKQRNMLRTKRAVVVASSAAPSVLARFSSHIVKLLKEVAGLLGANKARVLFVGLAAMEQHQDIGAKVRNKARVLGVELAKG
jgi:NAD(P)H-dependent FMN reductase